MDKSAITIIFGLAVFIYILITMMCNKKELDRYQALKNKRRFSGRSLSQVEKDELNKLAMKYWWY